MNDKNSAIVVVDMLYDFIDGTLACLNAEKAVEKSVEYIKKAFHTWGHPPIAFIKDSHPTDHCSFKERGGDWPIHCVEGTHGGDIHESLTPFVDEGMVFFKGRDRNEEQYSGAQGLNEAGQSLCEVLNILDIKEVVICGIATEFCVKNTALDLLDAGFKVSLLKEGLGYVSEEGHKAAIEQMKEKGIHII